MQKAAPNHTPPASVLGSCPTDEELAAYIDGNLDKAERERITDHLASCEDCYALYTETARFLLDSGPATPDDSELDKKVVEFPSERRRFVSQWGSIAALLLLGAGIGTYFQLLQSPPTLVTAEVTSSIPQADSRKLWSGPRFRGSGDDGEEIVLDDASFRLGVQLVNLQVSLKANDRENAADAIAFILNLLKSGYGTEEFRKDYAAVKVDLVEGKAPADVFPEVSRLARESRDSFDDTSLDFGQWVEAARLAAISGDPSFFQQSSSRNFLRRLLWRDRLGIGKDEFKLDPATRESLQRISDVLGKGDLQAPDYAELRRQTEKILEIHYPEA
jgi:hypothetical protein